ncbi:MAG: signal peptidase II [Parachlamydiales bacterium]|jgi:signal peptidase II
MDRQYRVLLNWAFFIAIAILCVDAWTKYAVYSTFQESPFFFVEYPVFKDFWGIDFSITCVPNKGAAWGSFAGWQNTLLVVRISTVLALIGYLVFFNRDAFKVIPLTFIAAGALGNVIDTFVYGFVVDMFLFTFWGHDFAVFNVADAFITVGAVLLCINAFFEVNKVPHAGNTSD